MQVIQLVEKNMLGFLSVNYQDEKVPFDKHYRERLTRLGVPAIDLVTGSVGVDDGVDDLTSNFVTEQDDLYGKLSEDDELAEAAGSSAPETSAVAMVPPLWDHNDHELTHLPYKAWCRACFESRSKDSLLTTVQKKIGGVPLLMLDHMSIKRKSDDSED
eukprot:12299595-Heterocapsa_arctica.AAC.1